MTSHLDGWIPDAQPPMSGAACGSLNGGDPLWSLCRVADRLPAWTSLNSGRAAFVSG